MSTPKTNTEDQFDGINALAGELFPGLANGTINTNPDDNIPYRDPEKDTDDDQNVDDTNIDTTDDVDKDKNINTDDSADDDSSDDSTDATDLSELGEMEPDISAFFAEKVSSELGIELEADAKFESVKDVVELMKKVVEENSKPTYPSEEIEALAKYVEDGGDVHTFYKEVYGDTPVEDLDVESETDQKVIVKEYLSSLGWQKERIDRTVKRYEDSGILKEQAEESFEALKELKEEKAEKLLKDQENQKKAQIKQQQEFIGSVKSNVESLKDFHGLSLTDKQKKEAIDFLLKPLANGQTKFQQEYAKDNVKNLIETALFLQYKDQLFKETTKKASSDAAKNLMDKLRNQGTPKRSKGMGSSGDTSDTSMSSIGNLLFKK